MTVNLNSLTSNLGVHFPADQQPTPRSLCFYQHRPVQHAIRLEQEWAIKQSVEKLGPFLEG